MYMHLCVWLDFIGHPQTYSHEQHSLRSSKFYAKRYFYFFLFVVDYALYFLCLSHHILAEFTLNFVDVCILIGRQSLLRSVVKLPQEGGSSRDLSRIPS